MATAQEIQDLEAKLKAAKEARLADAGDLAIVPVEEVTLGKFTYHGDALRLQDPIKYAAIQRNLMVKFVQTQMIEGTDFGTIPGIKEKCLFKPGAERLATLFNYSISIECVERHADYDKGFFAFTYKATIKDCVGRSLSECEGNCNSKEKKYAQRTVGEKYATEAQKAKGVKQKSEKGNWLEYVVPNEDIYSQVNTLMKMSQKRAVVGAVILACNASSFFKNAENLAEMPIPSDRPVWEGETIDADIVPEQAEQIKRPANPVVTSSVVISDKQIARMMAMAGSAGYTEEAVLAVVNQAGFISRKDIPCGQDYEAICATLGTDDQSIVERWNDFARKPTAPALE
jgi:hypothetical protein